MQGGLNIGFAGTPELAAYILKELILNSQHNISLVFTQPDRRAGRGKKIRKSPVKQLAESYKLRLAQPANKTELEKLDGLDELDVLVVAAYGIILTEQVLHKPRYGCINVHTSLLPRWRGAAPIQHAILAGDDETGITIMQMDAGLDTGNILYQQACAIEKKDSAGSLHDRLAELGAQCLMATLDMISEKRLSPLPQDGSMATYAAKIHKHDARIDWTRSATEIDRLIRAMNPDPVAYTELNNTTVRVWEAEILDTDTGVREPGSVLDFTKEGLLIASADKVVRISKLQLPGKKILDIREFYNGNPSFIKTA